MTAHATVPVKRTRPNQKDGRQRRPRARDLEKFGFKAVDWNKWSFDTTYGLNFRLVPIFGGGWRVDDARLDDVETFAPQTPGPEIVQRLEDLAEVLTLASADAPACAVGGCKFVPPCKKKCLLADADWLTAALPETTGTPERWQSAAERYGLTGEV